MKSIFLTLLLSVTFLSCFSQNKTESELKALVQFETEAYMSGDSLKYLSGVLTDKRFLRSFTGNGFHIQYTDWNQIAPMLWDYMRDVRTRGRRKRIESDSFVIHTSGDLAWMNYRQHIYYADKDSLPIANSYETRTLIREKGKWKIATIGTIDSLSYAGTDPYYIENSFNSAGYAYLAQKKVKEAIEIFKLNVTLFPESWNAYDSLGEAYAADGNKELAIKNYERSIELNPKSESGPPALKKLKGE